MAFFTGPMVFRNKSFQFLEPRSGQGFGEIHAVKQRLDLYPYLVLVGKRPLGAFGFATKLLHGLDVA